MKTISTLLALVSLFGTAAGAYAQAPSPASSAAGGERRVGVYDSRALSYAHFWSEPVARERERLGKEARDAKTAGQAARAEMLGTRLTEIQRRSHLQVFSTAPADEALAVLQPKLAALQAELGVERLVSKWDESALRNVPESQRVDVTDRLVGQLFTPDARHTKVLESMKARAPIPLDQARKLADAGKL